MIRSVLAFNFGDMVCLWSQVYIHSWQWVWQLFDYTKRDYIIIFRIENEELPTNIFLYHRRHEFQTKKVRYLLSSIYRSYFKFYVWIIKQNWVYSRKKRNFISFLRWWNPSVMYQKLCNTSWNSLLVPSSYLSSMVFWFHLGMAAAIERVSIWLCFKEIMWDFHLSVCTSRNCKHEGNI